MDYNEEEENARYAEELAASSDPLEFSGVDLHGFRQPQLQDWELDDETEAQISEIVGTQHQSVRGMESERGWEEVELQQFQDFGDDDVEMQEVSSPTPASSQQPLAPTSRTSRYSQQSQLNRPSSHGPLASQPRRPVAKPQSNFIPLRPAPVRALPAGPSQQKAPMERSSAFPIPANGNTNRRKDFQSRPNAGPSQFQPQPGGDYAPSQPRSRNVREMQRVEAPQQMRGAHGRIPEAPEPAEDEEDYFGAEDDAAFESALVQQQGAIPSAARPRPQFQQAQPVAPQARYRNAPLSGAPVAIQRAGVKLRPVSDLPDMYRRMWKFGCFNVVQTTCFDSVYQSDENVVVSAPTGSGKTVLFELAILRLFSTSDSNDAKAVYMAPTKALTSERAADWKKKFEQLGLGWTVVELTGDTSPGPEVWKSIKRSRLIVTTPEKWDSITRSWHNHDRSFSQLALFCIDECHSVGMDVRGATLEVVVSRMKTLGTNTRFLAVSATVPNVHDVAEWLGSGHDQTTPATVYEFNESYRPCKLQRIVMGYPPKENEFSFNSTLNFKLWDLLKQYSSGKPVLIFCNTRKACSQAAEVLAKEFKQAIEARRQDLPWPKPGRIEFKTVDKKLAVLLESGIAYHHAGLEQSDRKLVESLFTSSAISVVCATSTLATGVNLPARMVVIKGTKMFKGARFEEYTDMDVLQMIGRAGRPQFDTSGIALIMTETSLQSHYEDLVNSQTLLESCLHKNLTEHINSEITLRTITNVASALHWLRSTFLFVRIKKNSRYYAIANGTATSPDARLEEIVVEAVRDLVSTGIVDETDDVISPTTYGEMMAKNYLSQPTFVSIKDLPPKPNMRTLLETIASAAEFAQIRFRQGEKGVLGKVNKNLRFPVTKLNTSADKVMILIQIVLECVPGVDVKSENFNPHTEAGGLWQQITRMVRCIVEVLLERRDGAVRVACELLRSIHAKAWDNSPFILRQIDGVGEKSVKALVDHGITSFAEMTSSDPARLEMLLGRNPPFGRKLIALATAFPKFGISLDAEEEEVVETGVKVTLSVEISVEQTSPSCMVKKNGSLFYACVILYTSDGEYIDFRRIRLEQLVSSGVKRFAIAVIVCRPSQRIVGTVSCDHVAGSEVRTSLKPSTSRDMFPLPTVGEEAVSDDVDVEVTRNEPIEVSVRQGVDVKAPAAASTEAELKPARKRPDGRYECNHACKDKTACKHMCCRDGLEIPPPVRRRKPKASKDDDNAQTKLDALSKTKIKITDSLSNTPALKSELLSPRPALEMGKPLRAFNGKTLKELIAEGIEGETEDIKEDSGSDEELLPLNQLLKQNKKKRLARDAHLDERTASATKVKKPPTLIKAKKSASPPKRQTVDVLALLASDDDQVDQLEDDSDLDQPLPLESIKRQPLRKLSRGIPGKPNDLQSSKGTYTATESTQSPSLFRSPSSDAEGEETLTETTVAVDHFETIEGPEEAEAEMGTDVPDGGPKSELQMDSAKVEDARAYSDDDDMEDWLASSVIIKK